MARKFKNVSPHGELIYNSRRYDVGDVVEVSGDAADRFAESTFNWEEVIPEKKAASKPEKADEPTE